MALVSSGPPSASVIESLGGAWVGEEALAIALLCAATCADGSAREAVAAALWRSVAHAGDSDSTGSMVGNLLGAMHGVESLPAGWLDELELVASSTRSPENFVQLSAQRALLVRNWAAIVVARDRRRVNHMPEGGSYVPCHPTRTRSNEST